MARTNLKVISVYLNEGDYKAVKRASEGQNRSMSNFLHTVGVQAAHDYNDQGVGFGNPEPRPARKAAGK